MSQVAKTARILGAAVMAVAGAGVFSALVSPPSASRAQTAVVVSDVANVRDFGAKGDGATDDHDAIQAAADSAFGPATSPHGLSAWLNKKLYFPPGRYRISKPVLLRSVMGGDIEGAGRFASEVLADPGQSGFETNGMAFSRFGGLYVRASGAGAVDLDLNWDGSGPVSLQSNRVSDCYFYGAGATGVRIGQAGYMGSENLFLGDFFECHDGDGLLTRNFNALQQSVVGGDFQSCSVGIHVWAGSVPLISGVGFQSNGIDARIDNGSFDSYLFQADRTEGSPIFIYDNTSYHSLAVVGCSQAEGSGPRTFLYDAGVAASLQGCISATGTVSTGWNGRVTRQGCSFPQQWFTGPGTATDDDHEYPLRTAPGSTPAPTPSPTPVPSTTPTGITAP